MNKKILLAIVIFAIVVIGYCMYTQYQASNSIITVSSSTVTTRVLINDVLANKKIQFFSQAVPLSFKNAQTGDIVSLKGATDKLGNMAVNLYINQENIGKILGTGILTPSFSPDNKYFGFIETAGCGATCNEFNIYIVDLVNKKISIIEPPKTDKDYTGEKSRLGYEVEPFIESYSWTNKDNVEVTFFFVGVDGYANKTYRVSPKEIWNYDLITNKYTLIQTLPE